MKSVADVTADIARRLARTWPAVLVAEASGTDDPDPAWPHAFPLGQPTGAELAQGFPAVVDAVAHWAQYAAQHQLVVDWRTRRVHGTDQRLPTHVHVPSIDIAADLAADGWPDKLQRARSRATQLATAFPHALDERTLSAVATMPDVDFDILLRAGAWFATHDATGLTPRQVPVEGVHAKWLNGHHALVARLAGLDALPLLPPHPARLHLTYLDPQHLAHGGRRHDCVTIGDQVTLPYRPRVILISENKDTAIHFPQVRGGVAVEGFGRGGGTAAAFDWLVTAPVVAYWGDMDADGLEILDGFRAAGVPAVSILMDTAAYDTWQRYGTDTDPKGRPLTPRPARSTPHLTAGERALYERLTDPAWPGPRRVEQERIPLRVALARLEAVAGTPVA